MEVHELKEWMDERMTSSDKLMTERFVTINKCIEKLDAKVVEHDKLAVSLRAIWWVVGGMAALVIGKHELWLRWFGGK
jgi:hypothetical protein